MRMYQITYKRRKLVKTGETGVEVEAEVPFSESVPNGYEVLGVSHTATRFEIKKVFNKKSQELHSDTNLDSTTEDEEKLKLVNVSWDVLSDATKRKALDKALGIANASAGTPNPQDQATSEAPKTPGAPENFMASFMSDRIYYSPSLDYLPTIEEIRKIRATPEEIDDLIEMMREKAFSLLQSNFFLTGNFEFGKYITKLAKAVQDLQITEAEYAILLKLGKSEAIKEMSRSLRGLSHVNSVPSLAKAQQMLSSGNMSQEQFDHYVRELQGTAYALVSRHITEARFRKNLPSEESIKKLEAEEKLESKRASELLQKLKEKRNKLPREPEV